MNIEVKLFPTLQKYSKIKSRNFSYQIKKGTTVSEFLKELGIPEEVAKIIIVNGQRVEKNFVLKNGDRLSIFPLIAGG